MMEQESSFFNIDNLEQQWTDEGAEKARLEFLNNPPKRDEDIFNEG